MAKGSKRPNTNAIIVIIALAVAGLFIYQNNPVMVRNAAGSALGRAIEEVPRNLQPMEQDTPAFTRKQMTAGKSRYTYFWFQPDQPWPEGIRFPLVMVLHGSPGRSYAARFLISGQMRTQYPAFVFVPVIGQRRFWAMPSENSVLDPVYALPDMVNMIEQLAQQYPVDTGRIYVIGCSDGGTGTYGAIRYYPDVFAAAVPISGSWAPEDGVNMTGVPTWAFHGSRDGVIPAEPAKVLAEIARSRGGNFQYTGFDRLGHNCPSPYFYPSYMWKWLFAQRRS